MEAIPHVLAYRPPVPKPVYGSRWAQTFDTREGQTVFYQGFKDATGQQVPFDHQTCLIKEEWAQEAIRQLTGKDVSTQVELRTKQFREVRELEVQGKNWALLDQAFRTSVVAMILGGQLLHYVGIDAPLIGGPLSTARWGLLVACIHPIAAPLALLHTLATSGPFIGTSGLLTRGFFYWLVTESVRFGVCRQAQDRLKLAFDPQTGEGPATRYAFVQDYQQLWVAIGQYLQSELDKAIEEDKDLDGQVVQNAKELLAKEADLRRIYGLKTDGLRNELALVCNRIANYAKREIPKEQLQAIWESKPQYPFSAEERKIKLAPYAHQAGPQEGQEEKVLKEVNQLIKDTLPKRREVRNTGTKLVEALRKLTKLPSDRPPQEHPIADIYWIHNFYNHTLSNAQACEDPVYLKDLEGARRLAKPFEQAVRAYEALTPFPADIERAIVITTLMADQNDDSRFGYQQRQQILELASRMKWEEEPQLRLLQYEASNGVTFNQWVNATSKKLLDELKRGVVGGTNFIEWAEALAPRAHKDRQFEEVNLDGYKFWDQYCRFKAAKAAVAKAN